MAMAIIFIVSSAILPHRKCIDYIALKEQYLLVSSRLFHEVLLQLREEISIKS